MQNSNRPTFFIKNKLPVRAAGILCYVIHHNKKKNKNIKYWLFRLQNELFTDTGGKTDLTDLSIIDTAIRETVEETYGHLFSFKHDFETCRHTLEKLFEIQNPEPIYIKSAKYVVYPLELRYTNKFLSLNRFDLKEEHDNKEHKYKWINHIPENIHPRLETLNILLNENLNKSSDSKDKNICV